MNTFKSYLGHRFREIKLYLTYFLFKNRRPLYFFSVSDSVSGFSSDLRGRKVIKELRSRKVNAIYLPSQLEFKQRKRVNKILRPNVVIYQSFRIKNNDPYIFPESLNILDLDDADFLDKSIAKSMEHRIKQCDGGIAGSRYIGHWMREFLDDIEILWTSTEFISESYLLPSRREKRVIWATTSPLSSEKEAVFIRSVLEKCVSITQDFEFVIIGRGNKKNIMDFFSTVRGKITITYYDFLPYDKFLNILKTGIVGLAPLHIEKEDFNNGKSFGKILGYLSAGLPIVTNNVVDHGIFFNNGKNGYISNNIDDWVGSIICLIEDAKLRDYISNNAKTDFFKNFSIGNYCDKLLLYVKKIKYKKLHY